MPATASPLLLLYQSRVNELILLALNTMQRDVIDAGFERLGCFSVDVELVVA